MLVMEHDPRLQFPLCSQPLSAPSKPHREHEPFSTTFPPLVNGRFLPAGSPTVLVGIILFDPHLMFS